MPSSVSPASRDFVRGAEQPVLVEPHAALERAIAQRDVVRLRAGEVLQRGAAALQRHQAQVGLIAAANQHARLGVALAEHAFDEVVRRTNVSITSGRRRPIARMSMSPQVSVAAPQAADDLE